MLGQQSHRLSSRASEPVRGASPGQLPTERNTGSRVCAFANGRRSGETQSPSIPGGAGGLLGRGESGSPLIRDVVNRLDPSPCVLGAWGRARAQWALRPAGARKGPAILFCSRPVPDPQSARSAYLWNSHLLVT